MRLIVQERKSRTITSLSRNL